MELAQAHKNVSMRIVLGVTVDWHLAHEIQDYGTSVFRYVLYYILHHINQQLATRFSTNMHAERSAVKHVFIQVHICYITSGFVTYVG